MFGYPSAHRKSCLQKFFRITPKTFSRSARKKLVTGVYCSEVAGCMLHQKRSPGTVANLRNRYFWRYFLYFLKPLRKRLLMQNTFSHSYSWRYPLELCKGFASCKGLSLIKYSWSKKAALTLRSFYHRCGSLPIVCPFLTFLFLSCSLLF